MNDEPLRSIHTLVMELRRAYENNNDEEVEHAIEALEKAVAHMTDSNSEQVAEDDEDDDTDEAG